MVHGFKFGSSSGEAGKVVAPKSWTTDSGTTRLCPRRGTTEWQCHNVRIKGWFCTTKSWDFSKAQCCLSLEVAGTTPQYMSYPEPWAVSSQVSLMLACKLSVFSFSVGMEMSQTDCFTCGTATTFWPFELDFGEPDRRVLSSNHQMRTRYSTAITDGRCYNTSSHHDVNSIK